MKKYKVYVMFCAGGIIVQFKKREKRPWRSVTFNKVAGSKPANLLKVILLHGRFRVF